MFIIANGVTKIYFWFEFSYTHFNVLCKKRRKCLKKVFFEGLKITFFEE